MRMRTSFRVIPERFMARRTCSSSGIKTSRQGDRIRCPGDAARMVMERLRYEVKKHVPVSYTHLDVYKRQLCYIRCPFLQWPVRFKVSLDDVAGHFPDFSFIRMVLFFRCV